MKYIFPLNGTITDHELVVMFFIKLITRSWIAMDNVYYGNYPPWTLMSLNGGTERRGGYITDTTCYKTLFTKQRLRLEIPCFVELNYENFSVFIILTF